YGAAAAENQCRPQVRLQGRVLVVRSQRAHGLVPVRGPRSVEAAGPVPPPGARQMRRPVTTLILHHDRGQPHPLIVSETCNAPGSFRANASSFLLKGGGAG